MKPAPFTYQQPTTIAEALALLNDGRGETKILAGGQSLVPMMNFRVARPDRLIDINGLPDLDYVRLEGGEIAIGALARHARVKESPVIRKHLPLVSAAYEWVAHGPVRNRGTLAGNLCHADPASEMPALMLALDATFVVRSAAAERRIDAADFFKGVFETALATNELLTEIRVPLGDDAVGWGFHETSLRRGDFAFACACALMTVADGAIATLAVSAAGIAERPQRLRDVEASLIGRAPDTRHFAEALAEHLSKVDIGGDRRVPADYRRDLAEVLTRRALRDAAGRADRPG